MTAGAARSDASRARAQPLTRHGGVLEQLGSALTAAGYTEDGIVGVTGAPDIEAVVSGDAAQSFESVRGRERLEVLVRAFLMGLRVDGPAMQRALEGVAVDDLVAAGVVARAGDALRSLLRITPFAGLLIASSPDAVGDAGVQGDYVMGVGMSSITLANLTIRKRVGMVLDLGCGSGIQSLLAARHADGVLGIDRNARAVRFARLNAMLNGVDHVLCVVGDLAQPVRDRAFDLIVCNPPMVVSPDSRFLYRDGPQPGDAFCAQLVRTIPKNLHDGGYFQALCHWVHIEGEPWQQRLAQWCADTGCDAWALQAEVSDPRTYAATWIGTTEQGSPEELTETLSRWMRWMEDERIEAIGSGLITLRKTRSASPWFSAVEGPEMNGPCGDHVLRAFEARDFLDGHEDDSRLLDARLRVVPEARREVQSVPGPQEWRVVATRLRLARGLCWSAQVDPVVAEFVGTCDGERTVGELLAQLPAGDTAARALVGVRKLVERGFVAPA